MKALILAAGYATRLYPLTKEYPKPLLEIGGRPLIDYIVDKLQEIKEIDEILVVTNSKFIGQFRRWKKGLVVSKHIRLIDDLTSSHDDKRGAIGDIRFVIEYARIKDDLLVIGGDNLFDDGLKDFVLTAAKSLKPVIGVFDLKDRASASKYGVVQLNRQKRIVRFQEKPKVPRSSLVAMCLYYFPRSYLKFIARYIEAKTDKHDATGFYIAWLKNEAPVYAYIFAGRWYDIGHHNFYAAAQKAFKRTED
jgi:glucose-1-phosphate thymidylyltransferase